MIYIEKKVAGKGDKDVLSFVRKILSPKLELKCASEYHGGGLDSQKQI